MSDCIVHFCSVAEHSVYSAWESPFTISPTNSLCSCYKTGNNIYLLSAVLPGCVASWPVPGWWLCPSNSTQTTDGCGVGHNGISHDSCCVSDDWHCYLTLPTLPTMTDQIHHQHPAGTNWSSRFEAARVKLSQASTRLTVAEWATQSIPSPLTN